eukprot:623829-Prymnesium_polylepis.1
MRQGYTCEGQLATHLERLPPEMGCFVVGPQEGGGAAQRARDPQEDCPAAHLQKHSVKQRNADRPQVHERICNAAGHLVFARAATDA